MHTIQLHTYNMYITIDPHKDDQMPNDTVLYILFDTYFVCFFFIQIFYSAETLTQLIYK